MPFRRRRPLLRAAAVGGGAYLAGKRAAERDSAGSATGAVEGGSGDPTLDRLRQLGELHDSGVLTDDEFAAQKSRLLGT